MIGSGSRRLASTFCDRRTERKGVSDHADCRDGRERPAGFVPDRPADRAVLTRSSPGAAGQQRRAAASPLRPVELTDSRAVAAGPRRCGPRRGDSRRGRQLGRGGPPRSAEKPRRSTSGQPSSCRSGPRRMIDGWSTRRPTLSSTARNPGTARMTPPTRSWSTARPSMPPSASCSMSRGAWSPG